MKDPYLNDNGVLQNLLNIDTEDTLEEAETVLSSAKMLRLYETGFHDFSTTGLCNLHKELFEDVYEWAGTYRTINFSKREPLLAGISVWYSNCDHLQEELDAIWQEIHQFDWSRFSEEEFIERVVYYFPKLWRIHPFREGNTRTIVAMVTFFFEEYGYPVNRKYLADHASFVRNAFVFCCLDQASEPEHLKTIFTKVIQAQDTDASSKTKHHSRAGYYKATPHEQIESYDASEYEDRIAEAMKNARVYIHSMEEEL